LGGAFRTYAPPGELAGVTLGSASGFSGFTVTNAYNDRLQPLLLSATNSSTSATVFGECFDFHLGVAITSPAPCSFPRYTTGDNGNVFTVANNRDSTRTQSFTYDSLNRIASAESSGSAWGETFTIDAWGNMIGETGISGKTNHEGLNTTALTNNQLSGFGYDAAGNMTSNGSATNAYDAENRLVWTSGYRYLYDGKGERVEKCAVASATTACPTSGTTGTLYWRGTGSDTLAETDLGGNDEEEYLFFNGQRIARRDVSSTGATIAVHYYFSDHLGTHGVVESATGTTCEQDIDYYPYGGVENDYCSGSGVTQNYKFTGKERDSESGLDNFGARYSTSSLGRFMTPDWAAKPVNVPYAHFGNPQSLNLYSYVQNNPTTVGDPDGHETEAEKQAKIAAAAKAHNTTQTQTQQNQQQSDQQGHWEYSQSTGQMTHVLPDGSKQVVGTGYSGKDEGLNNPKAQDKPNVGPIPQGDRKIEPQKDNVTGQGHKLPASMRLDPSKDTDTFGRSGFLIHGDNSQQNHSASNGCIILNRPTRNQIGGSGDNNLTVVP
jgi:RHS repeat-associated protein